MCFVFGQIAGTFLANFLPPKPLLIFFVTAGGTLLAAVAANPLDLPLTTGLITTGVLLIGMAEGIAIASTTFNLRTQEEIGTAGGLSGAIRSFGSAIGTVVYGTILTNRLARTVPALVGPAALGAGLPASSLPRLIATLEAGATPNTATVPGLSEEVLRVAEAAYRVACAQAYRTVFLSTLGFSGVAMVLVWFTKGVDEAQATFVASHIHRPKDERILEQE